MEEKEFTWTDALVLEFANAHPLYDKETEVQILEQFKQSKQKQYPPWIISFKEVDAIIYKHDCLDYQEWVKDCLRWNRPIHSVQNGDDILTVGDMVIYVKKVFVNDGISAKNINSFGHSFKVRQFMINSDNILIAQGNDSQCEAVSDLIKVVPEKTYTASEATDFAEWAIQHGWHFTPSGKWVKWNIQPTPELTSGELFKKYLVNESFPP